VTFRSSRINRALLNIGGIANITVLPKGCSMGSVLAFDTGPGNMVIDALMKRFFHLPYDRNGAHGRRGELSVPLLKELLEHQFIRRRPPKSTGRETFGREFVEIMIRRGKVKSCKAPEDLVRTASELTARSVYENYRRFITPLVTIDELIVSGGGAHNHLVLDRLADLFNPVEVKRAEEVGISVDAKEAICFALLAAATIQGTPGNLPRVTGASRPVVLGKVCF